MVHKRHLNKTCRLTNEVNDTPIDAEPMKVHFDTFDVAIPRKAPKAP